MHQPLQMETHFKWEPHLAQDKLRRNIDALPNANCEYKESTYKKGEMIATRKAYGQALLLWEHACKQVVSLDAEVKNSTFAEIFEEKYPERFFQCFVAEQNMVGMGVGFDRRG